MAKAKGKASARKPTPSKALKSIGQKTDCQAAAADHAGDRGGQFEGRQGEGKAKAEAPIGGLRGRTAPTPTRRPRARSGNRRSPSTRS
jgi:hypothetical protein